MIEEQVIDVADLDCVFLTYDEPQKEEFWIRIQNMVPWAKRVDGVFGSDAAHKAAAQVSDTDRFVLIDGDNIPDPDFFNLQLKLTNKNHDHVFRWKARNEINGLMYGNGGLSCWTKQFIEQMRTHEHSDGSDDTCVEFCFDPKYQAMHDCYSTTYPNGSPYQAWRAGFREGVKMCLDRGAKPNLQDFERSVHHRNYDHLCIWQTIGRDVENGWWAIYGARLGTYYTMLKEWDYRQVQDFNYLKDLWQSFEKDSDVNSCEIGKILKSKLNLPIAEFNAEQSSFFKNHYRQNYKNLGAVITEMGI